MSDDVVYSQGYVNTMRDKISELEKNLEEVNDISLKRKDQLSIAHEAMSYCLTYKSPDYFSHSRGSIFDVLKKAKDKIKNA